ncbi:MAG: MFS transporter [Anaerolineales bacterium]|nr:MFS transporter [Anaerolineales bacterium]
MQPQQPNEPPLALASQASQPTVSAARKWWVLLAIGAGTFMTALDTSVVNTVLPIIRDNFSTDVATVEWVVIVYLLSVSGLLPIFGRLGDIRGHKQIYLSGFGLFILSSLLCALSWSVQMLVAFRGLQALGAAMLSSNSPAILTKSFPSNQRGQALGMQATMTYLGLVAGPALGGWLTELINWRSVFYINVPVGLIAFALSLAFIPRDRKENSDEGFDIPGAITFLVGLVALLLGLNQGHNWGWTSPLTLSCFIAAAVLMVAFVNIERRVPFPMLDLTLFKRRLFTTSISSAVINYICVYSNIFLMPFYLIQGRNLSPSQAGLLLTAQPIVMAVVAPISGTLSDRIGTRLPTTLGMTIMTAGLWRLSLLGPATPISTIAMSLAFFGLGVGIFISPNNSALMGSARYARQGIAAGMLATARNVGMVLGVGLSGAIFNTLLAHGQNNDPFTLFNAIQKSFLAAMLVSALGIVISAIRGNGKKP